MRDVEEYSAGGIVTKNGKVLLIRMKTVAGKLVWTFPKGHLEKNERPRDAALREVTEESGYECSVRSPLSLIRYSFFRGKNKVRKRVRWYWMAPGRRVGKPDPKEIYGMKWLSFTRAKDILKYPADFRLIDKVQRLDRGGKK
jgi:ADP-ribose pyrophosphatase YjhB (NUDIX family)